MSERDARDPVLLRAYEGLVFSTAAMLVRDLQGRGIATAEDDLDDIRQLLRIKVYRALRIYNPAKLRRKAGESIPAARDRYVFMCVRDCAKDIAKRKRKLTLMIEDVAPAALHIGADGEAPRDNFDARYLAQSHEEAFASVEISPPPMPASLSALERAVLVLLYRDYTHREIAARLSVSRGDVSTAVRALRQKLADWQPAQAA